MYSRLERKIGAGLSVLLAFWLLLQSTILYAEEAVQFQLEEVAEGLGVPWGMAFLDEQTLLVTERSGAIRLLLLQQQRAITVAGAPEVVAEGQGGLLDVAVPADFRRGKWIYFTYSKPVSGQTATTLARAQLQENRMVHWEELLVSRSATDTHYHFGSRIAFDDMGHLYFTVGDRGERPNGQDLSNHAATVLRLHRDGTVPADNPFVGERNALSEIWSYGHRNPQGIAIDSRQRVWAIEHGPRGGDEINRILPGRNYGWPVISYGKEYWGPVAVGEGTHREGMEQPVKYYVPSIAPGSLLAYSGKAFPQWRDHLFAGALNLKSSVNPATLFRQHHSAQ